MFEYEQLNNFASVIYFVHILFMETYTGMKSLAQILNEFL